MIEQAKAFGIFENEKYKDRIKPRKWLCQDLCKMKDGSCVVWPSYEVAFIGIVFLIFCSLLFTQNAAHPRLRLHSSLGLGRLCQRHSFNFYLCKIQLTLRWSCPWIWVTEIMLLVILLFSLWSDSRWRHKSDEKIAFCLYSAAKHWFEAFLAPSNHHPLASNDWDSPLRESYYWSALPETVLYMRNLQLGVGNGPFEFQILTNPYNTSFRWRKPGWCSMNLADLRTLWLQVFETYWLMMKDSRRRSLGTLNKHLFTEAYLKYRRLRVTILDAEFSSLASSQAYRWRRRLIRATMVIQWLH